MADVAVLGLRVDASGAIVATEQLGRSLNKLGVQGDVATASTGGLSRSLRTLTGGLTALAGIAAFKRFVDEAQAFERQMALVSTVVDTTTVSMAGLEQELLGVFAALPVRTIEEMTKGLYDIASSGVAAGDAIAYLGVAAKSAVAGITTTAVAVDGLTSVTNAFALQGVTVTEASDKMFQAVNKGKITFEQLSSSIGTVAPIAAAYGIALEDVLGATAQLTLGGQSAEMAMVGIRSAIVNITKPSEEFINTFPQLAKEFNGAKLEGVGFTQFLVEFAEKSKGSKDALNLLFADIQGRTSVMSLLKDGGKAAAAQVAAVGNAAGETQKAFDKIRATSDGLNQILRNELTVTMLQLGKDVLPAVNVGLQLLLDLLNGLRASAEVLKALAIGVGLVAGAWSLYTIAVGSAAAVSATAATATFALYPILGGLGPLLATVGAAFAAMWASALLPAAAVAAAIAGVAYWLGADGREAKAAAEEHDKYNKTIKGAQFEVQRASATALAEAINIATTKLIALKAQQAELNAIGFKEGGTSTQLNANLEDQEAIRARINGLVTDLQATTAAIAQTEAQRTAAAKRAQDELDKANAAAAAAAASDKIKEAREELVAMTKAAQDAARELMLPTEPLAEARAETANLTGEFTKLLGQASLTTAAMEKLGAQFKLDRQAVEVVTLAASFDALSESISNVVNAPLEQADAKRAREIADSKALLDAREAERVSLQQAANDIRQAADDTIQLAKATQQGTEAYWEMVRVLKERDLARTFGPTEAKALSVVAVGAQQVAEAMRDAGEQAKLFKENLVRGLQENVSGFFEGLATEGVGAFDSMVKRIKQLFLKMFADLASAKLLNKLATTSVGGFLGLIPSPSASRTIGGGTVDGGQFGNLTVPSFTPGLTTGQRAAGIAGAAIGGGLIGYGIGTATQSKSLGALGGAAAGAAMGAQFGPWGAAIGGVVGAIGGLIGGHKAQKKAMEEARQAIKALNSQLAGIRFALNDDALGASVEAAKKQFTDLRKSINDALKGRKNETERNRLLAEANALEAQSIAKLQEEFALKQQFAQQDAEVRRLVATGRTEEAASLAAQIARTKELADLRRDGATAETIAAVMAAQLAEEERRLTDARRAAAQVAEEERRRLSDLSIGTVGFTDPRGADDLAFAEEQQRRLWDAVSRGASEAELVAIRLFNVAQAAAREAEQLEATTRAREALVSRGLAASGDTRGAEDAARQAAARQELADAIAQGMDPVTLAILRAVQAAEASQARMQRAIGDGTAAIEAQTEEQVAVLEAQITAIRASADAQVAAINLQIAAVQADAKASAKAYDAQIAGVRALTKAQVEAIDAQLTVARDALDVANQQVSVLQESVSTSQQVVSALRDFSDSLSLGDLSTLSPQAKLEEARKQFEAVAASASAGDANAASQLPGAANALLQASRGFNASNAGFVEDFSRVQTVLATVATQFGGKISADQQALAAAQSSAASLGTAVTLLQSQRDFLADATEAQLAALEARKEKAAEEAQATIDRLTDTRDTINQAAADQIAVLADTRDRIVEASQKQIAALVKLETEAHAARLEADANWKAFLDYIKAGGTTATADAPVVAASAAVTAELRLVQDAIRLATAEQVAATLQVATPVVAMATALRDAPPPATAFTQDLTLDEQRRTNDLLREKLDALGAKLDVLTNTTAAAANAEIAATATVAAGISVLATETRNAANAAVVRARA